MKRFDVPLVVAAVWTLTVASGGLTAAEPKVLRRIADFEQGQTQANAIVFWRWQPEEKQQATRYSQIALADVGGSGGGRAMKVVVPQPLPKGSEYYPLWSTGLDYLPPEADAVRLRVKVVSGRFHLTVGSPTVYFANSDVRAKPQALEAGDWRTIEFSLVRDLERNYRRPIFSQESPVIYYTRWVQEPMRLLISADSRGELWVDDLELVAKGIGQPFPSYAESALHTLNSADGRLPFTFATDDREFALSHTAGKEPVRKPALLTPARDAGGTWSARQRGQEEMSFFGVPLQCPPSTNAVRLTLTVNHEGPQRLEELCVDALALVAPKASFQWNAVRRQPDQQGNRDPKGYDYCLSPSAAQGRSWGFYHARRVVSPGKRTELVIPLTDFVCAYGAEASRNRQRWQEPLNASEVMAIALVSPFRQNRGDTVFTIERIEAVEISPPNNTGSGRGTSYPTVPDISKVRLQFTPGEYERRAVQMDPPPRE